MDYRDIIKAEFARRLKLKVFYSLRAFAKDLRIKPIHLSYLMSGKRGLSKKNALMVAAALGLKASEREYFRFLVSAQSGRSKAERALASQGLKRKSLQSIRELLKDRIVKQSLSE